MSKLYAIYAQKHKMDRMDPLKCLELARLLTDQETADRIRTDIHHPDTI